ncbi:hypothetical protein D3C85_944890 [compost metagenome]
MIDGVEDGRYRRQRTAQPQQQGDQTQMTDRRIGEQTLEIILKDCAPGPEHQGRHASRADDDVPGVGAGQHRPQADHQKDARLHHGGRMQIGADRRGGGHRARQPEVEGELRALGQCARQDQDQGGQIPRAVLDDVAGRQHHVQVETADDAPQHHDSGQKAEPARRRHRQRHPRAVARRRIMVPVADQQEGEEAGQLPENGQLDQIAGHDHAGHRPHEGQQEGEEARDRIVGRHIVAGVEHHEGADALDHDRK